MKKRMLNLIMILVLTIVTFYIVFTSTDIAALPNVIQLINTQYILAAVACIFLYFLLNSLIIYTISKEIIGKMRLRDAVYLNFIGLYYGSITPLACGSLPSQIVVFKSKYQISVTKATSITMKKFVVYQVVISLFALLMFILRYDFITTHYHAYMIFIVIGLVGNLAAGLGIILVSYRAVFFKGLFSFLLKLAHRFKLFKKHNESFVHQRIDEFVAHIEDVKKNKKTMILIILYTVLQTIVHLSPTYFIYIGFGQNTYHFLDLLAIQTLIYVAVSFVPTPGNAGASEGGFYVLLRPFFPEHLIFYSMAIWRVINYYGVMLFSGLIIFIVRLFDRGKPKIINKTLQ